MRKIILNFAVTLFYLTAFGQEFSVGPNIGIPVGDSKDYYDFIIGVDVNYLWETSETLQIGLSTGFNYFSRFSSDTRGGSYILPNIEFEIIDFGLIPITGALRLKVSESFLLGSDFGYGIIIGDLEHFGKGHSKGGVFYRPMIGYSLSNQALITISYRALTIKGGNIEELPVDGGTIGALTVGIIFNLNRRN